MLMNLRDVVALLQHAGGVGRRDFAADGAVHNLANAFQVLAEITGFLGQQRRVGGHAVENAKRRDGFDLFDAAGVDEQFHEGTPELQIAEFRLQILFYRAVSSIRSDGGLTFPALSTALSA